MKSSRFTTVEIIFISSMIALDFAFGLTVRPLLTATGITEFFRVDLIVPTMMLLVTRMVVDKFGTIIIYEIAWSALAVIAMPASFGLPGLLKMVPAIAYGIILDSLMMLFSGRPYLRLLVAAVFGGVISQFVIMGLRVLYGMPWSTVVKLLFGFHIVSIVIVAAISAHLALIVWKSLKRSGWTERISGWRTS